MKHGDENQRELGLMGGMQRGGVVDLPAHIIAHCRSFKHAMWEAVLASPYDVEQVASLIGYKNHSSLSRIMNVKNQDGKGARFLPDNRWMDFCNATGNYAIYQYREMERRGELDHQRVSLQDEEEALLERLDAIRARRSA